MQAVFILGLLLAALVSSASAGCACDDDFSGFGTEPGKCGCCPWPCCCKCFTDEDCTTSTTEPCQCIDLCLIIDESGSISNEDWQETLEFLDRLVKAVSDALAPDTCGEILNVAMITFGTNATLHFELKPASMTNILDTPQAKKQTNIVEGMELAIDEVYNRGSECIPFAIIMTDGKSIFRKDEILTMGAAMRDAVDDNIACIGITSAISEAQLFLICPEDSQQFSVLDYDELIDIITGLVEEVVGGEGGGGCTVSELCFCCCSPEQFWGAGRGYYGR